MTEDTAETLTIIGELVIDTETGEVVEDRREADDAKLELLEFSQRSQRFAAEQESEWKRAKQTYGRIIGRLIEVLGVKSASTDYAKSTAVADGTTRKAPREKVDRAVELELMTTAEGDALILSAATQLDVEAVEDWIVALKQRTGLEDDSPLVMQLREMITLTPRAGYVRTTPARKVAPKVEVVER